MWANREVAKPRVASVPRLSELSVSVQIVLNRHPNSSQKPAKLGGGVHIVA